MVRGIHRVMLLCAIVLLAEYLFGTRAMATDNRVKDLAKQAGVRILQDSTSDRALQKTAAAQVPLQNMSQRSRQRAMHLLENTSQYRRMPTLQYEVDASLYQYLINHPDVAIATWRVMEISKLNMWQTAPFEYAAEAVDGSEGRADVLWRDANQCLFVVEGAYHSPLLPGAIEASALVWLRYRFQRTPDNKIVVSQQIETFLNFPSAAIEAIAKLASMVTNSILDRNVMEVSLYAQMMSRAAHKDPRWIEEVAGRMEGVPEHRKTELARVAYGRNPYEQPANDSVASTSPQNAGSAAASVGSQNSLASATLSDSKQQLLQAVRAGNVVVIVKPSPEKSGDATTGLPANPRSDDATPSGSAIRTAMSATQTPSVARSEAANASKVSSSPVSSSPVTSSPVTNRKSVPASSAKSNQHVGASKPIARKGERSASITGRPLHSGDSKDGSLTPLPVSDFSTGPVRSLSQEQTKHRSKHPAKHQAKANGGQKAGQPQKPEAVPSENTSFPAVSINDQPALVVLPPVASV